MVISWAIKCASCLRVKGPGGLGLLLLLSHRCYLGSYFACVFSCSFLSSEQILPFYEGYVELLMAGITGELSRVFKVRTCLMTKGRHTVVGGING